jgi:hypothetical protein
MKNLIVLGSGRSGTSAVSSLFRNERDVFFGYDMMEASEGNPTGFYECEVVNTINNILLRQMTGVTLLDVLPNWLVPLVENRFPWTHRDTRSLWLARPKRKLAWRLSYDIAHLISRMSRRQPFCFKDPRFGFTLPLWRPYLPEGVRFLVVFRDPAETVASIMKHAAAHYGDRPLPVTEEWAISHWKLMYESILSQRRNDEDHWMIVDFADVLSGEAIPALRVFADAELDLGLLKPSKPKLGSSSSNHADQSCQTLMNELRRLAYNDLKRLTPSEAEIPAAQPR